jgi:hypothetical protein
VRNGPRLDSPVRTRNTRRRVTFDLQPTNDETMAPQKNTVGSVSGGNSRLSRNASHRTRVSKTTAAISKAAKAAKAGQSRSAAPSAASNTKKTNAASRVTRVPPKESELADDNDIEEQDDDLSDGRGAEGEQEVRDSNDDNEDEEEEVVPNNRHTLGHADAFNNPFGVETPTDEVEDLIIDETRSTKLPVEEPKKDIPVQITSMLTLTTTAPGQSGPRITSPPPFIQLVNLAADYPEYSLRRIISNINEGIPNRMKDHLDDFSVSYTYKFRRLLVEAGKKTSRPTPTFSVSISASLATAESPYGTINNGRCSDVEDKYVNHSFSTIYSTIIWNIIWNIKFHWFNLRFFREQHPRVPEMSLYCFQILSHFVYTVLSFVRPVCFIEMTADRGYVDIYIALLSQEPLHFVEIQVGLH